MERKLLNECQGALELSSFCMNSRGTCRLELNKSESHQTKDKGNVGGTKLKVTGAAAVPTVQRNSARDVHRV